MTDDGHGVRYSADEEDIVYRLGVAVVMLWSGFSKAEQDALMRKALFVDDTVPTHALLARVRELVRRHAGEGRGTDAPPA